MIYKSDSGLVDVRHDLEELDELQDVVERGPHWDTIDRIVIERSDKNYSDLTIEQAVQL